MTTPEDSIAKSMAAYSVLESLVLELSSCGVVRRDTLIEALGDAVDAHEQSADEDLHTGEAHRSAAELIRRIVRQLRIA
jgi:hypothetical protein